MTKRDRLPLGPRGHHIANLHLTIIDNDSINKQFHQLATLGESQVVQRWPEAVAEGVDAMRQGQDIDLLAPQALLLHGGGKGQSDIILQPQLRHQGHVAFDRQNNRPLSNLFVRMIQQMGIEARSFGTSTGVVSEV